MSFSVEMRINEFEKRQLVKGPLWLRIDNQDFPIDGWYDFPVVIMGWWLNNIKPLITKQAVKCECPFMDGPYRLEISVRNQQSWILTFIKDNINGRVCLIEREADSNLIISEILKSSSIIAALCQEKGWESEDLATLTAEVEEVSHLTLINSARKKESESRHR